MTFDDGPHATNTPKLLEMAARGTSNSPSLSLAMRRADPDVLLREVTEGHEIGNHSWSHPNLANSRTRMCRSQLQRTEDLIEKTAGIKPKLMRPPYGELTKRQRILVNHEFGYKVILWDVDPLDWKRPGSDIVAQRIIAGARPGSIILSHDIHPPTIAAMPQVFDALLAKGFKFVTVSELLAMDKGGERNRQSNSVGFQRKKLRSLFVLISRALPTKIYQWCEASERRHFAHHVFYGGSAIFEEFEVT